MGERAGDLAAVVSNGLREKFNAAARGLRRTNCGRRDLKLEGSQRRRTTATRSCGRGVVGSGGDCLEDLFGGRRGRKHGPVNKTAGQVLVELADRAVFTL